MKVPQYTLEIKPLWLFSDARQVLMELYKLHLSCERIVGLWWLWRQPPIRGLVFLLVSHSGDKMPTASCTPHLVPEATASRWQSAVLIIAKRQFWRCRQPWLECFVYRAGRVVVGEAQSTFLLAVCTQGGVFTGPSDFER